MDSDLTQRSDTRAADKVTTGIWLAFGAVFFINSVLRGIRAPGRWVCTEMLLNYDFGFSKRGLIGAIISTLHLPALYHYSTCFWYTSIVLSFNLLLLTDLLRRLFAVNDTGIRLASLVFTSSLAVVVLAHTIGYGDQSGLLITLVALRISNNYLRTLFAVTFVPVFILAHETSFVIFFPVILFRFLIDLRRPPDPRQLVAVGAVIISAFFAVILTEYSHIKPVDAVEMAKVLQERADYNLREGAVFAMSATLVGLTRGMVAAWSSMDYQHFFLSCVIVTMPTTIYLMREFLNATATTGTALLRLAGISACLSPLTLHIIANDFNRWSTLAITTSFLVLSTSKLYCKPTDSTYPLRMNKMAIPTLLVAFNLGSSIPLFDGYIVQSFPYEEHIQDVVKMITGKLSFPPPPEQCMDSNSGCVTVVEGLTSKSALTIKELSTPRQQDVEARENPP